jgi:hypothetical protein
MTTPKIHTSFDTETNHRLDQLFAEWTLADNRAAAYDYGNTAVLYYEDGQRRTMSSQPIADEADSLARQYDALLANAKKTRQPHQINAGVYNSTYTFSTAETAQIFAQAVNGDVDGRTVKTQASLWDINGAIARNMILDSEILRRGRFPVNMAELVRMQTAGGAQ